jgi:hypothetical protein
MELERRIIIHFLYREHAEQRDIHARLSAQFDDDADSLRTVQRWCHYNESPKVVTLPKAVTPIAPAYFMVSAGLSQLPDENLGLFHQFEMRRSVKLINSAQDVGPASFLLHTIKHLSEEKKMAILIIQQTS